MTQYEALQHFEWALQVVSCYDPQDTTSAAMMTWAAGYVSGPRPSLHARLYEMWEVAVSHLVQVLDADVYAALSPRQHEQVVANILCIVKDYAANHVEAARRLWCYIFPIVSPYVISSHREVLRVQNQRTDATMLISNPHAIMELATQLQESRALTDGE